MSLYRLPTSPVMDEIENMDGVEMISVARYSSGMRRGQFNEDRPEEVVGYFYYLEPESTTYLLCDKSRLRTYYTLS